MNELIQYRSFTPESQAIPSGFSPIRRRSPSGIPVFRPEAPLDLPAVLLELDVLPLVVELLPPADADLHLDLPVLEIHPERDQGKPPLLGLSVEPPDLPLVQEELADAKRVMILPVAVRVGADVEVVEEELVVLDQGVAVLEVGPAVPEGLHLGPHEGDPRLIGLVDEIVHPGPFVRGRSVFPLSSFFATFTPVLPFHREAAIPPLHQSFSRTIDLRRQIVGLHMPHRLPDVLPDPAVVLLQLAEELLDVAPSRRPARRAAVFNDGESPFLRRTSSPAPPGCRPGGG